MDTPGKLCPHCGEEISEVVANGRVDCPFCGRPLKTGFLGRTSRGKRWALFWGVFLLTPALGLLTLRSGGWILILLLGALYGGAILTSLVTKNQKFFALWTILLGMSICVVYGAIAFAGCVIALGSMHN